MFGTIIFIALFFGLSVFFKNIDILLLGLILALAWHFLGWFGKILTPNKTYHPKVKHWGNPKTTYGTGAVHGWKTYN